MGFEALWPQRRQSLSSEFSSWLSFRLYLLAKRSIDLVVAVAVLLLIWPLLLIIAALIKLDTCGPVLFTQTRAGARWRASGLVGDWEIVPFGCHKFRTMFHQCDQSMHEAFIKAFVAGEIKVSEESGCPYKLNNDPRVTRVGRWLRKFSLDELPQLFNILKGEMSLVGPRPVPLYEVAAYKEWHRERLKATPGLTGMWQVWGRSLVSFDEMARLDIEYIQKQSIVLDLKLILATIPAVLSGRGAG